ncbi:hypothetical protein V1289_008443 [Bradyrhizobium sp. AZCC 2289]|jgi:hypothetical protein
MTSPLSAECNQLQRLDAQRRTAVPAHAARAPHCGRSGAGFGSILRVEVIKRYTKVQFVTSFVAANFTLVQLWQLPADGIQGARNPSLWMTHV